MRGGSCGVFGGWLQRACAAISCRGLTGGGCWGFGRAGQCGDKVGGRLCGRFDNRSSGGRGSEFQGNRPNRKMTAGGASNDADMSRSWVGMTWPITEKILYRRQECLWAPPGRDRGRAVCGCERVTSKQKQGRLGARGQQAQ